MSSTPRASASSSRSLWESPDMPILTEDVLNQYGHLTVEQFLQQQCEAQIALVRSHAASLVADLQEKTKSAREQLMDSATAKPGKH